MKIKLENQLDTRVLKVLKYLMIKTKNTEIRNNKTSKIVKHKILGYLNH